MKTRTLSALFLVFISLHGGITFSGPFLGGRGGRIGIYLSGGQRPFLIPGSFM